jgi:glutathione reductase (NADPH)
MAGFDFDLVVIGGGSGGVRAARMAARAGARVALAEEFRMGGTCVIRGCVPKKLYVMASAFRTAFEDAAGFGWSVGETRFDWAALRDAKEREITRLEGIYAANLESAGVTLFHERATVAGPHAVRLASGRVLETPHILIATGGTPAPAHIPGAEFTITSNEVFDLPEFPGRIVIEGGGYVASEFAGVFNGLGARTTQLYRGDLFLRGFDAEIRAHVAAAMRARGVDLRFGAGIAAVARRGGALVATLKDGSQVEADAVMLALGRRPNTEGLGLAEAGVRLTLNGAVAVDAYSQSSVPSIYAVGDVTDRLALTPVAIREGAAFAATVFEGRPTRADHSDVATAVFTQPEIGTVGASEEDARAQGPVEIFRALFRPMANILAGRDERTLMKLVVARDSRRVLGVHLVGPASAEMIQLAGVAVKMGATKEDFDRTVAVHPTAAEELVLMREPVAAAP